MRRVLVHPTWLTPTVRDLAAAVAQDEDFDRLPILADALEDAGCTDDLILGHCRDRALEHVPRLLGRPPAPGAAVKVAKGCPSVAPSGATNGQPVGASDLFGHARPERLNC